MEKAVDWVIDKGAKAFNKVGNKVKNSKFSKKAGELKDSAKEKYKAGKQWVEDKKEAGQQWVNDKKAAAQNWVEEKKGAVKEKFDKFGNKVKDKLGFGQEKKAKDDNRTYKQKQDDLNLAVAETEQLMQNEKLSFKDIKKQLPKIKAKYKMTSCKLVLDKDAKDKTTAHIEAEINPKKKGKVYTRKERRDVQSHENLGGHTDERHIGKSENWLKQRLNSEPDTESASSFYNDNIANLTQGKFVKQFRQEIEAWLTSGEGRFVRVIEMDKPIGIVVARSKKGDPLPAVITKKARLVLLRDNSSQGWHFLTCFPEK